MSDADEVPADSAPLDPILEKILDAVPFELTADGGVEEARRRFRKLPRTQVHPELRVENQIIDGPAGPIPVRVYWPSEVSGTPAIVVFAHGGGFAVGDLDTHDREARFHAVGAGAVVVSVDYRLAPEHPHPAAVEDVWAATKWAAAHGGDLGADPTRLAVAGDSAGGTLSAVMCQLARDAGGPAIAFQLLWYPGTTFDHSLPSFAENANAPILGASAIGAFTRWYAPGADYKNPPATLAPARATDLSGLPPAYIGVAGHDPLRDDGIRYAELLRAAGVSVELDNARTLPHGFLGYAGYLPAATEAMDRGLAALKKALHA